VLGAPQHDGDAHDPVGPTTNHVTHLRTLAAGLLAVTLLTAACGRANEAQTDQAAPSIEATTLDGLSLDLASYRGRPVIVNFWASWCQPCREEFPLFQERLATLGPRDGLVVIGVLYKDQADLAAKFLDEFGASWPTVLDPDGSIAAKYRVVAPPQTYFIDGDGILRGMQIGQVQPEDFDTQYTKIAPQ